MSRAQLARIRNQKLGFVFQNFNCSHAPARWRMWSSDLLQPQVPRPRTPRAAVRMLERVGLGNRADHTPAQLSGGQQQRVASPARS
jgi:putative ABC transport system ATP-binding protein